MDDDDDNDDNGAGEDERVEQLFTNPSKATIRRMLAGMMKMIMTRIILMVQDL